MKKLIILGLLCSLAACKKITDNSNPNKLQIKITNLSSNTRAEITVTNTTHTSFKYAPVTSFLDTLYNIQVNKGDHLTVEYTFYNPNISPATGTVYFYYNGQNDGAASNGSGSTTVSIPTE